MAKFLISYINNKFETIQADEVKAASPTIIAAYIQGEQVGFWNSAAIRYFRNADKVKSIKNQEEVNKDDLAAKITEGGGNES
jgi:hypothetical protein